MNPLLLISSILILLELVSLTTGKLTGKFDSNIPLSARGIENKILKIPCGVTLLGKNEKVQWRDVKQNKIVTDNGRVRIEKERYASNVWNLVFEPLLEFDKGFYECIIAKDQEMKSLYYNLAVLEPSDDIKWNISSICRFTHDENKEDACDAGGSYPCCNYNYFSTCGYSPLHCDCFNCIDYRHKDITEPYFMYPELTSGRAKVGQRLTFPCYVKNLKSPITFERLVGDEYEVLADPSNPNFKRHRKYLSIIVDGIFYPAIFPVLKSDEGKYRCRFLQNGKTFQKEFDLKVFDESEKTRWRSNGMCGRTLELYSSNNVSRFLRTPCDEHGLTPCCSPFNTCGGTVKDCKCDKCVDYRDYDQLWKSCEKSEGSFPCNPGNCINSYLQCDGKYDCDNGADERKCEIEGVFAEIDNTELNSPLGENFTLPCKVMNLGKFETVNWRRVFGDLPLPSDEVDDVTVSNSSDVWRLHFVSTDSTHQGRYSCEIRTETGVSRQMYDCKSEGGNFTCEIHVPEETTEEIDSKEPSIACSGSLFASYLLCLSLIFMVHLVS